MNKDKVIPYKNPAESVVADELSNFIRISAQKMLKEAVSIEVNEFIDSLSEQKLADGKQRVVKNGYLPERAIQTGVGPVKVKLPRVRDRSPGDDKYIFISNLIPKYMRRTASLDVMLPLLYLKGISAGDMPQVMAPLLGENASSVSEKVVRTLKNSWNADFENWQQRDLSNKRYVYWWVDGIYITARMETEKTCLLVIVAADEHGNKSLLAVNDGFRESKQSWINVLQQLNNQGLKFGPNVAVGDGALGFWGALSEVYPKTKHQRCWVHKTANVLDKLPKSQRAQAKSMLHDIYMAATKNDAINAMNNFVQQHEAKYPKAVACLVKDKDQLLTFYNYPAEHWVHLRTTNPIESTFATVRHRTRKSKNCLSRSTALACVFKLCIEAQKRWKKLNGANKIADVINLVKYIDGIRYKNVVENNASLDFDSEGVAA